MRTLRRITLLAALACALAVSNAQAGILVSDFTNEVNLSAVFIIQQGTNGLHHGTNIFYVPPTVSSYDTAKLISEIGTATTNNFSKDAKFVLITQAVGGRFPYFAMIDGSNYVDVSSIVSFSYPDIAFSVNSGVYSGIGVQKFLQWTELDFADTNLPKGTLEFKLRGLASGDVNDTAPNTSGVFTETYRGKISSMTGNGLSGGNPFVATGTVSLSGKGPVQEVP